MTDFVFQTQYTESSDRLNRVATLISLDTSAYILVIQYNLNSYDWVETKNDLDNHLFKETQNMEIITEDHKYYVTVSPMVRRSVDEHTEEVEYIIYAIMENE